MSHSDTAVAGGYKKPTLRKLRGRVNLDQEKGEVTNNASVHVLYVYGANCK